MDKAHSGCLEKLVVVLPQLIWQNGKRYATDHNFVEFILAFKAHFKKIILLAPISYGECPKGLLINIDCVDIQPLPFYNSLARMYFRLPLTLIRSAYRIKKAFDGSEVTFLFQDDVACILLYGFLKKPPMRTYYWIRADIEKSVASLEYSGMKRAFALIFGKMRVRMDEAMARRCHTLVVGDALYEKYRAKFKKIYKIHVSTIPEEWIREKAIDIEKAEICLLAVCRLHPVKGLKYLIRALPIVINQISVPVRLLIVGSGKEEESLKMIVRSTGLLKNVEFAGYVPFGKELMKLYDNSDIFISPSISEGFPATIFEAMARGVSIICTDVGGISAVIKDGENGLLVAPRSSIQLASAIIRLARERDLRSRLARRGLGIAKEFSKEAQVRRIINYIKSE